MTADSSPIPAAKQLLRKEARQRRARLWADQGAAAAQAIARTLAASAVIPPGTLVAGYWPMAQELDPRPALEALHGLGHPLCLPVVTAAGEPLLFRRWAPGDGLMDGGHGTRHPLGTAPLAVPEVLLVPLLAYDDAGFRLGYGGGYYDRTLAALDAPLTIGVAFAGQRVAAVPHDPYDRPLDHVLTERGLVRTERAG